MPRISLLYPVIPENTTTAMKIMTFAEIVGGAKSSQIIKEKPLAKKEWPDGLPKFELQVNGFIVEDSQNGRGSE